MPADPPRDLRDALALLVHLLRIGNAHNFRAELRSLIGANDSPDAIDALAAHAFGGPAPVARNRLEAACLAALATAPDAAPPPRRAIDPDLDWIGESRGQDSWITAQWVAQAVLRHRVPTRPPAVVVCMRDDGLAILEWVAHYRVIGFDRLFVYTNDNADGSDALLARLAEHGLIHLIDNPIRKGMHPQRRAFDHAIHALPEIWQHGWVFFADSDEFLLPGEAHRNDIRHALGAMGQRHAGALPAAICYRWRWYVAGGRFAWEPGLLQERFRHAIPDKHVKAIVRMNAITSMRQIHFPDIGGRDFIVDERFAPIDYAARWDNRPVDYAAGQISHFWCRSFEEFSLKKARGDSLDDTGHEYARQFSEFFHRDRRETDANLAPPPAALIDRVKAEVARLEALPGVGEAAAACRDGLPRLLARFGGDIGLKRLYVDARRASLTPATTGRADTAPPTG